MPCDTVREVEVEWKVASMDTLFKALQADGLSPVKVNDTIQFTGGSYTKGESSLKLQLYSEQARQQLQGRVNRAYSTQIVRDKMRGYGWKEVSNKEGKLQFQKR